LSFIFSSAYFAVAGKLEMEFLMFAYFSDWDC
jgi:hypothetical protein